MRILLLTHRFLPRYAAGTEVYTEQLGLHLAQRGHEVLVVTAEKDVGVPDFSVRRRAWRGLQVVEVVNNLFHGAFRETWEQPEMEAAFAGALAEFDPDVVHVQHLLYWSAGCVEIAAREAPVLFTLHDYWLQCARFGQRVHADGSICHEIDHDRCGGCLAHFKYAQSDTERRVGKGLARLRASTGIDLSPAAHRAARLLRGRGDAAAEPESASESSPEARAMAEQVRQRERDLFERVLPHVTRFLSPSRFLRERFVEWGVEPDRIDFLRTGIDLGRFQRRERSASERVRIAFVGTVAPHKGPHVLVDAWSRLPEGLRERATLDLHGPGRHHPAYAEELGARCRLVGATLHGELERDAVAELLPHVDLLVVPSVWYENSPLVIIEALAAGTPLLVSDIGGMVELVESGASGWHFKVGDSDDLARRLREILESPEELARVMAHREEIKSVVEDAEQLEEIYFEALDFARAERARRTEAPSRGDP